MKVSISSFILLTIMMLLPLSVKAAGHVTFLNVDNDAVYFATAEIQAEPLPSCVIDKINSKYAVSLNTEMGRAIYSLLITAMASKQAISVASAGDCDAVDGVQRATGLSIVPIIEATQEDKSQSLYLYAFDDTKLGRIVNTSDTDKFYYLSISDSTELKLYTKPDPGQQYIYYSSSSCTGTAHFRYPNKVGNHKLHNDGQFYRSANQPSTIRVLSLRHTMGTCMEYDYVSSGMYQLSPHSIGLCGIGFCKIKEG